MLGGDEGVVRVTRVAFSGAAPARHAVRRLSSRFRAGNVAMFHGGRSGSTVLGQMLAETRRVLWAGELYETPVAEGTLPVASDVDASIQYLRRHMINAGSRFYGFEVKFQQLRALQLAVPECVDRFGELGFEHFIVLRRRNSLRALVSVAVAAQDGRYHQSAGAASVLRRTPIPIETTSRCGAPRSLIDRLRNREQNFSVLEQALVGRNVLQLTYEEDVNADPQLGYRRICSFLDIEPGDVPVRLGRTNPFPLRQMIENVDEVERALQGSPYQWMLEDPSP
ncbi:MAG: hypothetical protein ABIS21_05725 [Acidimicrobiales bacterium]